MGSPTRIGVGICQGQGPNDDPSMTPAMTFAVCVGVRGSLLKRPYSPSHVRTRRFNSFLLLRLLRLLIA